LPSKPIEDTLSFKFVKLVRAHRDRIASSLRDLHLYPGQELMLSQLWKKEGLNQSELAATCGLEPPTITKVLERMSGADLVQVKPDPDDKRVRRVYLTDRGRALKNEVRDLWSSVEGQLLRGFNKKERDALRDFLNRMRDNIAQ